MRVNKEVMADHRVAILKASASLFPSRGFAAPGFLASDTRGYRETALNFGKKAKSEALGKEST